MVEILLALAAAVMFLVALIQHGTTNDQAFWLLLGLLLQAAGLAIYFARPFVGARRGERVP